LSRGGASSRGESGNGESRSLLRLEGGGDGRRLAGHGSRQLWRGWRGSASMRPQLCHASATGAGAATVIELASKDRMRGCGVSPEGTGRPSAWDVGGMRTLISVRWAALDAETWGAPWSRVIAVLLAGLRQHHSGSGDGAQRLEVGVRVAGRRFWGSSSSGFPQAVVVKGTSSRFSVVAEQGGSELVDCCRPSAKTGSLDDRWHCLAEVQGLVICCWGEVEHGREGARRATGRVGLLATDRRNCSNIVGCRPAWRQEQSRGAGCSVLSCSSSTGWRVSGAAGSGSGRRELEG